MPYARGGPRLGVVCRHRTTRRGAHARTEATTAFLVGLGDRAIRVPRRQRPRLRQRHPGRWPRPRPAVARPRHPGAVEAAARPRRPRREAGRPRPPTFWRGRPSPQPDRRVGAPGTWRPAPDDPGRWAGHPSDGHDRVLVDPGLYEPAARWSGYPPRPRDDRAAPPGAPGGARRRGGHLAGRPLRLARGR